MSNPQSTVQQIISYFQNNKKSILLVLLANFALAFSISAFVIKNGFILGGATGASIVIQHHLGGDLSSIVLAINIFAFTLGSICLGKHFAITTIISALSYPFFLKICLTLNIAQYSQLPTIVEATLAAMTIGFSITLILKQGASSAGMDTFALILQKYKNISLTVGVNTIDGIVLLGQMSFSNLGQIGFGLYILLVTTLTMKGIEMVYARKTTPSRQFAVE